MKLLIYVPLPRGTTRGNWITALRWAALLRGLGHTVTVVDPSEFNPLTANDHDLLIALHARRSHAAVHAYRDTAADVPVVVALTGTDLQSDLVSGTERSVMVLESLQLADRIVLLEPEGLKLLPAHLQDKCVVILQSSKPVLCPPPPDLSRFQITVLAHLRDVKDPFLIAKASNLLPAESRIHIVHMGGATSDRWDTLARQWTHDCKRYEWVGAVPHHQAQQILSGSRLTVLSSRHEGAPSVFSEAAVCGVPIVSTRISAAIGILGADYPGLFDVGDETQLASMLWKAESDDAYYRQLATATTNLKQKFAPERESNAWKSLLTALAD